MSQGRVLITGASGGIGSALAEVFAAHGYPLILTAPEAIEALDLSAETLRRRHQVDVRCLSVDLTRRDGPTALYEGVRAAGGEVEILVNNAGLFACGPFADAAADTLERLHAVNIRAVTELMWRFGRDMRARGGGLILNVCSTAAFQPVPGEALYAATKAFMLSLSAAVAIEWESHGVSVTAVCPGFTRTDMIAKADGTWLRIPGVPLLEPRAVAEQAYEALMAGRPVYVNGFANRCLASLSRLQPHWVHRAIGRWISTHGW